MITSISLTVSESPTLPARHLEALAERAAELGMSADEFLAELIRREVEKPNGKAA